MSKTHGSWHGGDDDSLGLSGDLTRLLKLAHRRRVLKLIAGAALLPLLRCGDDSDGSGGGSGIGEDASDETDSGTGSGTADGSCGTIPEETAGPYPGDGSNGPNALSLSGIVRADIRSSIAGVSGTAAGLPLTIKLQLVDATNACAPLAGYAVYLWHCTNNGLYSLYTLASQNYLRGVQETDNDGNVSFTTIFPGCYDGRMPHVHFEVYPTLASATKASNKLATSQLAFPRAVCDEVYATTGYEKSVANFAKITFASDNVFSDGVTKQVATMSGEVGADDLTSSLTVAVNG